MMVVNPAAPTPGRSAAQPLGRSAVGFAAAAGALIALGAFGMTFIFRGADDARTIWITALIALSTQVAAFPLIRTLIKQNLMMGWGAGTLIRFLTLGVYALVVVLAHLPVAPALLSLALFYFISSVIEPLFLRS